jgi:hypothetical protein
LANEKVGRMGVRVGEGKSIGTVFEVECLLKITQDFFKDTKTCCKCVFEMFGRLKTATNDCMIQTNYQVEIFKK